MTTEQSYTLDDAQQMLRDGSALGLQLRYVFENIPWCDTLMRVPTGVRLVRIRQDLDHTFANP